MENDEHSTHSMSEDAHLWITEATLDVPVCFPAKQGVGLSFMYLSLGGEDPDGFVQMRPIDGVRATTFNFWSANKPIVYECRALVRAPDSPSALLRGTELFEHVADRLTLLTGYPARVLTIGYIYDEDMLKQCIAGDSTEYDCTTAGQETFSRVLKK